MKISGIYKIQSISKPERIYIGSGVDVLHRWHNHFSDLKLNKHHSKKLQRHYNKYGKSDLVFSIIAVCNKEELKPIDSIIRPEQFFIWAYDPYFNNLPLAGSHLGAKRSLESCNRIGNAKRGKSTPCSQETKNKLSEALTGHFVSDETKEKLRKANFGKKQSKETIAKRAKKLKGKTSKFKGTHQTAEQIEQRASKLRGRKKPEGYGKEVSERMMGNKNALGRIVSFETREKNRLAQMGKKYSEESKRKMSESHLGKPSPMKGKHTGKPAWNKGLKKGEKRNVGN